MDTPQWYPKGFSFPMKLRVVSPRETIVKYAIIEVFSILFFLLILRNLTPYRYFTVMQLLQYALLTAVGLFILIPVWLELFGFGAYRMKLTKRGVAYLKRKLRYRLSWEDVRRIIVTPDLYGSVSKRCYIVFYAEDEPQLVGGRSEFHAGAFGLQYRKGLPEIIAQYCDLPIERLGAIEKPSRKTR